MDGMTYQGEENSLLYTLLDKRFFSVWRNPDNPLWQVSSMELFITPDCNQACEYCYLDKFKDSLYPKEARGKGNILPNLHKILDWMMMEGFQLNELQLFSGEIWHLPFGFELLDIILSYIEKGLRIGCITIPTNSCFACKEDTLSQMQNMVNRFSNAGCRLSISHSIEGKMLEDVSRPLKGNKLNKTNSNSLCSNSVNSNRIDPNVAQSKGFCSRCSDTLDAASYSGGCSHSHNSNGTNSHEHRAPLNNTYSIDRDDEFYENVLAFAKRNTFFFHPMVAAANIERWIENYDWFKEMCKKYDMPFPRAVMMLEVRNSDWTLEKLEHLKRYYEHQIAYLWEESERNMDAFLAKTMGIANSDNQDIASGYSNIALPLAKTQAGCSIPSTLTIRVGDLQIVPCHRMAYPQFSYGKLRVENEKISGLEAINTQTATKILYSNNFVSHHGCDVCAYNGFCMRCCYGEQYEAMKEPFMPDPNVCNMFMTKYNFLIDTYEAMGVLAYMSKIPSSDTRYLMCQMILMEVDRINENRRGAPCTTL